MYSDLETVDNAAHMLERLERLGGVGQWRVELETNELYWSSGVYAIHGVSPDTYEPTVQTAIEAYIPEDRELVKNCIERAIEHAEGYTFECRIRRPDGDIRIIASQGEVETDKNGKVTAMYGVVHDITTFREQEMRFQLAAMGSLSVLWDWDVEKDKLFWDGRVKDILGYDTPEDLPDTSLKFFKHLVHPDDHLTLKNSFADHFAKQSPFELNFRVKNKSGQYRWFLGRAQAQWNEQNRAIRISGSITDIHEIKDLEQRLLRSNADLNQFASVAAHDLQRPLRAISGFLTLLHEQYKDKLDNNAQDYIERAVSSAENMSALIKDLLEYSRLGTETIDLKLCDIDEVIEDIKHSMQIVPEQDDIKIEYESLPQIVCDRLKIHRLFYNLIENGIKYKGDKSPVVKITCEQLDNGNWLFRVKDNGIGIDTPKHEELFKMFTRLHKESEYEGTGVGLAICKKVIDLHDGEIWIDSAIGQGSTFSFIIPQPLNHALATS